MRITSVCKKSIRTMSPWILFHPAEVGIIPLSIIGQQLCEWPEIFHPELLAHCILLEEAATQVEIEHGVEHVHPLIVGQVLQEVAVRVSSEVLWIAHFLAICGHVVHS